MARWRHRGQCRKPCRVQAAVTAQVPSPRSSHDGLLVNWLALWSPQAPLPAKGACCSRAALARTPPCHAIVL